VPQGGVEFVLELVARTTPTGSGWIAALCHEIGNHAVEDGVIVKAFPRQEDEVVHGHGDLVGMQVNNNLTQIGHKGGGVGFLEVECKLGGGCPLLDGGHAVWFLSVQSGLVGFPALIGFPAEPEKINHVLDGADVAALVAVDGLDGHPLHAELPACAGDDHFDLKFEALLLRFQDGFHQAAADQPVAALVVTDGLPQ